MKDTLHLVQNAKYLGSSSGPIIYIFLSPFGGSGGGWGSLLDIKARWGSGFYTPTDLAKEALRKEKERRGERRKAEDESLEWTDADRGRKDHQHKLTTASSYSHISPDLSRRGWHCHISPLYKNVRK